MQLDRRHCLAALGFALGGLDVSGWAGAEAKPAGTDFARLRLSLNENPYGPAPGVRVALEREFGDLCRYTGAGYDTLVEAIARKERIPADQIILGEILEPLGTHLSLTGGAGGEFIYSDPGYTALIDSAAAVGGRGVPVPLTGSLENDLAALGARINARTRALFLVNPHNPTGTVSDPAQLKQFARDASQRALVIVDEAYLEYADGFDARTLTDLVRDGDNVIVFRTFAKIYGLAGLEIGYGLMPKRLVSVLKAQGLTNPHLFNRLAVAAATASLEDGAYVERVRQLVAGERRRWIDLLHSLGRQVTASAANFIFFETGMNHADFAARLSDQGIEIGREFAPYQRWARVSIGLAAENSIARDAVRRLIGATGA
jgi:histidinol-phosphate aminotransferase